MKPSDVDVVLTPEAREALHRIVFSRRRFIKDTGALVVAFGGLNLTGLGDALGVSSESVAAQRLDGAGSNQLDAWIAIGADGRVTAYTGKCEFGHGLYTAQTQLVAEELSVPFSRSRSFSATRR